MKPYMSAVADILNKVKPESILDAPSGKGWLHTLLTYNHRIDGVDLFETKPEGYSNFVNTDLDYGIPESEGKYGAIVSCEGIEHIGNPLLFLTSAKNILVDNGVIIITTPNIWYPGAKLKYFFNGFFPSFPCLTGKICRGSHMHIMPWSYPQLFLYLKLSGYSDIQLYDVPEKKPKYFYEYVLGSTQKLYCKRKYRKASSDEEKNFWKYAGSDQSLFGRKLVVSAVYHKDSE